MRRDIVVLPAPASVKLSGLTLTRPGWLRSVLAIAAGIGFAIFLFGLSHSPFGSNASSASRPR